MVQRAPADTVAFHILQAGKSTTVHAPSMRSDVVGAKSKGRLMSAAPTTPVRQMAAARGCLRGCIGFVSGKPEGGGEGAVCAGVKSVWGERTSLGGFYGGSKGFYGHAPGARRFFSAMGSLPR